MGAAEDFVENLKLTIQEKKHNEEFRKNILQECVDVTKSLLESHKGIFIRSLKDFDSKNFSVYLDLVSERDLTVEFSKLLHQNNISFQTKSLTQDKSVFLLDLEKRIVLSGSPNNLFFVEIVSKKFTQYRLKFTLFNPGLNFCVFEKNFYLAKFWMFDNPLGFSIHELDLNQIDRDKKKQKVKLLEEKYRVWVCVNNLGEFLSLEIKKAGEKTKK